MRTTELMEKILDRNNLNMAYTQVKRNKGSYGVDKMTTQELLPFLKEYGQNLIQEILQGSYKPLPVRRVEIPKPDGGKRLLGIPSVKDRFIQQAITQVISPYFEEKFSDNSFGFRKGKSTHDALLKAKSYIEEGCEWVVDIDLEKFFDKVNHDMLMARIARVIKDKRVLKLIRSYLNSGILTNGIIVRNDEGTPQGGPISPLLSNIMLDDLDKELERRKLRFVRYADDSQIYVKSQRAAERVMESITNFIENKLKLKVNKDKSQVGKPFWRKFLGYGFYKLNGIHFRVHPKSVLRLKQKIKVLTNRNWSISMETRIKKINRLIIGWVQYFKFAHMKSLLSKIDEWTRRRLRAVRWKEWKKIKPKFDNLRKLGIDKSKAWEYANSRKKYWRISLSWILTKTLTNDYWTRQGYKGFYSYYSEVRINT